MKNPDWIFIAYSNFAFTVILAVFGHNYPAYFSMGIAFFSIAVHDIIKAIREKK